MNSFELEQQEIKKAEGLNEILKSAYVKTTIEALEVIAATFDPYAVPAIEGLYQAAINLTDEYRKKKVNALVKGINERKGDNGRIVLTDKTLVELEQTIKALDKTSSLDKIFFIGQLYAGCVLNEDKIDIDTYEEMLEAINSISYRQIEMLVNLKDIEDACFPEGLPDDGSIDIGYYPKFLECCQEKGMSLEFIDSLMISATKSGFCRQVLSSYLGNKYGKYETTKYFSQVVEWARGKIITS